MKRIHLDYNATTPLRAEARDALLHALDSGLGNASSVHGAGRRARAVVDDARAQIASALGVDEDEVLFTSGGTEANNLALFGALAAGPEGMGVVTSQIEHAAVLEPAEQIAASGRHVARVGVDAQGQVDLEAAGRLARTRPTLVSIMAANNEIGSTVDLASLRNAVGERAVIHTDAVQLLGKRPIDLASAGVDLATFSPHKVGGPLGVGILVRRAGTPLAARAFGGSQEAELRPGTENVPAIAAAAVAVDLAVRETTSYARHTSSLAQMLWSELSERVPDLQLNGPGLDDLSRLPNTLNLSAPTGDARTLVVRLDLEGLEVSAGSACASGSLEPSHVLRALGLDAKRATSGLRISLGSGTSSEDIHTCVERLGRILGKRRKSIYPTDGRETGARCGSRPVDDLRNHACNPHRRASAQGATHPRRRRSQAGCTLLASAPHEPPARATTLRLTLRSSPPPRRRRRRSTRGRPAPSLLR